MHNLLVDSKVASTAVGVNQAICPHRSARGFFKAVRIETAVDGPPGMRLCLPQPARSDWVYQRP